MTGINLFVAKVPAAEAAGPVSSSGAYTNGLFSVTSSVTPISLPAGDGTVKLTYTLTNTGSEALWYTTDNNNVCATQVTGFTASVYSPGEYFRMPGETASFSCSGKVTHQDKANAHVPGPNGEPLVSTGAQGFVRATAVSAARRCCSRTGQKSGVRGADVDVPPISDQVRKPLPVAVSGNVASGGGTRPYVGRTPTRCQILEGRHVARWHGMRPRDGHKAGWHRAPSFVHIHTSTRNVHLGART